MRVPCLWRGQRSSHSCRTWDLKTPVHVSPVLIIWHDVWVERVTLADPKTSNLCVLWSFHMKWCLFKSQLKTFLFKIISRGLDQDFNAVKRVSWPDCRAQAGWSWRKRGWTRAEAQASWPRLEGRQWMLSQDLQSCWQAWERKSFGRPSFPAIFHASMKYKKCPMVTEDPFSTHLTLPRLICRCFAHMP